MTLLKAASLIASFSCRVCFSETEDTKSVLCLDSSPGFDPVGGMSAVIIVSLLGSACSEH